MPSLRGMAPTSNAKSESAKPVWRHRWQQYRAIVEGTIVKFHDDTLQGIHRGWNFEKLQNDWLVRPQHISSRNSKKQTVANLTLPAPVTVTRTGAFMIISTSIKSLCLGSKSVVEYLAVHSLLQVVDH